MMATALDKDVGVQLLTKACENIGNVIKSKGGDLNIKNPVSPYFLFYLLFVS